MADPYLKRLMRKEAEKTARTALICALIMFLSLLGSMVVEMIYG